MYGVSQYYRDAMEKPIQHHRIRGTIGNVSFTDSNILEGSFQIIQQCCGNSEVQIGQVMISELTATFRGLDLFIPRGSWQGKEITVVFEMLTENPDPSKVWEAVPVGVYTIDEADWSLSGVTVKAYDHMAKLDKRCGTKFTNAKPYDMLVYACTQCGLTFGSLQSEVEAMANGTEFLTEYADNDIETWRDFVSWLSQALGGFCYAGRDGNIYVCEYLDTYRATYTPSSWFQGAKFSDFATRYTGMSVVNMKYGTTTYYTLGTDDALTYNLGQNPFLQNYTERGTSQRGAVLRALQKINYVPFQLSMIGNVMFDIGDVLRFQGGSAGIEVVCCITKMVFKHKQGVSLQGVGKNPASASAKSKTDKNISGLLNRTVSSEFRFENIFLGREMTVEPSLTELGVKICETEIQTGDNAQISALTELLLDISVSALAQSATLVFTHVIDGEEFTFRHPTETLKDGKHIIALQHYLTFTQGSHKYAIWLKITDGTADIADSYSIVQTLFGTGLQVKDAFDGNLEVTDEIGEIPMPEIPIVDDMEDEVETQMIEIQPRVNVTDELDDFAMPEIYVDLTDVEESLDIIQEVGSQRRITEIVEDRHTEEDNERWTEGAE